MKPLITLILLLFSTVSFSQKEEQEQVIESINIFFAGFHTQDSTLMKSVVFKDVIMQSIGKNKDGETQLHSSGFSDFLKQIVSIPEDNSFLENLMSYSVQIDGNMANVWTPYEFWFNDQKSHCGVNSFQLIKDNDVWKIIYLVDTRRKCEQ
ncbi:nuclear transport factor 2 family protein [Olleya sp. YS]|uniref:nuclear transport factor 2 family protein n=1 Tax=Olleya sp. YS TaxID=3028318 RepID=UPI00243419C8|nr:nuclear transport factor 2 family protein [Olleya sp. YS]WGD34681.1 nuclear transport factor 2 family protein [Olleya sp. YS]